MRTINKQANLSASGAEPSVKNTSNWEVDKLAM